MLRRGSKPPPPAPRARVVCVRAPWLLPAAFGALIAVALVAAWASYEAGREKGISQAGTLAHDYAQLVKRYDAAQRAHAALREEKTVLVRSGEIEREAQQEVARMMRDLQAEVLELREELAFYRGIVSPTEGERGLRLKALRLEPTPNERLWRYRVILTQVLQNDSAVAEGNVSLQVHGLQDDEPRVLALGALSEKGVKEVPYRFRYFQNLDGELLLPAGFLPLRAEVQVKPRRRGSEPLVRTFDWPSEEDPEHVGKEQETFHGHH
ncbi:hypothetical protein HUS23_09770 [Ectothiorhodospiraceae bacterium 2226]|nr:hypothetical protein HUS23_09770 [Ectothiorhodospiraceae bacterium 2226]